MSATILDDKNDVAGVNLEGSTEAVDIIRTITVKRSFSAGKWKLHLENRAAGETELVFTIYVDRGAASNQGAGLYAAF